MALPALLRELTKAHAAFLPADAAELRGFPVVATGANCWGCGRHLRGWGHYELRAVLQVRSTDGGTVTQLTLN